MTPRPPSSRGLAIRLAAVAQVGLFSWAAPALGQRPDGSPAPDPGAIRVDTRVRLRPVDGEVMEGRVRAVDSAAVTLETAPTEVRRVSLDRVERAWSGPRRPRSWPQGEPARGP